MFCCTVVPLLVFMVFPLYIQDVNVEAALAKLFALNLSLGLYFQVRGHAAIRGG